MLAILLALLILWGVYKFGYSAFSSQKKYDSGDDDGNDGANLSATFSAENTARSVYTSLDGGTDYEVFMDTMNMLLALSNDELVATHNEYISLYAKTEWPTLRSNIMAEDLSNWYYQYPLSGLWKVDAGEEARDQVIYRMDQLNLS